MVIPRASSVELLASQFVLQRPEQLQIYQVREGLEVSWKTSSCTELCVVSCERVSGEGGGFSQKVKGNRTRLEGLESCTDYEVSVIAVLGHLHSKDASALVSTIPGFDAVDQLDPILQPSENSLTATWIAYEKLNCVKKYLVAICKEGSSGRCPEGREELRDDAMPMMTFRSEADLDMCTDYTLHITPLFNGKRLKERKVAFRTLPQPVEDAARLLTLVEIDWGGDNKMISLRWNPVQCVAQYQVFRKINTVQCGMWEKIGSTKENWFKSKGSPCTEYKFGVKVRIEDQLSEVVEFATLMTKADTSVPYVAANLTINPTPDGAFLTWDRDMCIKFYMTRACQVSDSGNGDPDFCFEKEFVVQDPTQYKMEQKLEHLRPCSTYTLEIIPRTGDSEELVADSRSFTTASPPTSPPQEMSVSFDQATNKVYISWSEVQCARGYRIYQTLSNSGTQTAWDEEGLSVDLENPEPCVTYSYSVSAFVEGQESEPTPFHKMQVPPSAHRFDQPVLVIEERTGGHVTLMIDKENHRCKVFILTSSFMP